MVSFWWFCIQRPEMIWTCELVPKELRLDSDFPSKDLIVYTHLKPLLNDSLSLPMPFSHRHLHIFVAQWKHSRAPWFTVQWRFTAIFCLPYDPGLAFRNAEQEGMPHCRGNLSETIPIALHSTPKFHPQFFFFFTWCLCKHNPYKLATIRHRCIIVHGRIPGDVLIW